MRSRVREETRNRMFPVGLYGTLLVGLFGVTFPQLFAPIETVGRTVVTLPLRAYSILLDATPVLAAGASRPAPNATGILDGQADAVRKHVLGPAGHIPRVCRVVDRREGPLGVDELILDRSVRDLAGCPPLVTAGKDLLGFLAPADGDDPSGSRAARVRLLHYRRRIREEPRKLRARSPFRAARIPAEVECREVDAADVLHFLVEPARPVDSWPLRCSLLDDSYLGSRLRHSGDIVKTSATDDPLLPAGLHLGRLMIWGYPELEIPIPVGLFVEPLRDPRGISSVLVWEPADGGAAREVAPAGSFTPVRFLRFPAPRPARERWMVTANSGVTLPDGAALVDGDRLLGILQRPWSGQSLVTSLGMSGRDWALLVRRGNDVLECVGRFVGAVGASESRSGGLRLRVLAPRARSSARFPDGGGHSSSGERLTGELFTGSNGRHCPAGLRIGTILAGRPFGTADDVLVVVSTEPVLAPEVFVGFPEVESEEGPR